LHVSLAQKQKQYIHVRTTKHLCVGEFAVARNLVVAQVLEAHAPLAAGGGVIINLPSGQHL